MKQEDIDKLAIMISEIAKDGRYEQGETLTKQINGNERTALYLLAKEINEQREGKTDRDLLEEILDEVKQEKDMNPILLACYFLGQRRKIYAIKAYKEGIEGVGIAEAKQAVDALRVKLDNLEIDLRGESIAE